jgi:hypothetical protein
MAGEHKHDDIDMEVADVEEQKEMGLQLDAGVVAAATGVLRTGLKNPQAEPTEAQKVVICSLLSGRDVLYIDRTGAGKSETYFVTTKMMRDKDKKAGPVIVVTPLIALINDQVRRATAFGFKASGFYSEDKGMSEMERSNVSVIWWSQYRIMGRFPAISSVSAIFSFCNSGSVHASQQHTRFAVYHRRNVVGDIAGSTIVPTERKEFARSLYARAAQRWACSPAPPTRS